MYSAYGRVTGGEPGAGSSPNLTLDSPTVMGSLAVVLMSGKYSDTLRNASPIVPALGSPEFRKQPAAKRSEVR